MSSCYDLIIVGCGISGLRVGIETLRKYPDMRCCIIEKYNYVGGRVITYRKTLPKIGKIQWENGAGRISKSHHKVLSLFKKYGLTFVPIDERTDFIPENTSTITSNKFSELQSIYLAPLKLLPPYILRTHTIKELLDKTVGYEQAKQFYIQFPYYAEIHTLRADIALDAFDNEMHSNKGFGVCKEGLSSMIDGMADEFKALNGSIIFDTSLQSVQNLEDNTVLLNCSNSNKNKNTFTAKVCVLALHLSALNKISCIKHLPVLKHLKMMPLLRIYAIFPVKNGITWFTGLNKIATSSPIRYIIPIDYKRGIIMISYTDGLDAKYIMNSANPQEIVMTEIRRLFSDRAVPDPLFFKLHPWTDGCTYWLPGNYDVKEESQKSLHPMPKRIPNLFMCGESFAENQCWMESGLDQADKLLDSSTFSEKLDELTKKIDRHTCFKLDVKRSISK